VLLTAMLAAGCTSGFVPRPDVTASSTVPQAHPVAPQQQTTIINGDDAVSLAVSTSKALFASAPAVVLIGQTDTNDVDQASQEAVRLGVPLLVTRTPPAPQPGASQTVAPAALPSSAPADDATKTELARLGAFDAVTVGADAATWAATLPSSVKVFSVEGAAPQVQPGKALSSLLVLALGNAVDAAAVATAKAAGATVLPLGSYDPRASSASVQAVAAAAKGAPIGQVLAIGSAFGPPDLLRQRLAIAATGVELPGGGQIVFPGRRMVALYGHPGDTGLGALGEQSLDATITRAKQAAADYTSLYHEPVVPAFEIIATVAAGTTGSNVFPEDTYRPWIDAAKANGIYVVLDLQPGDTDFLTQAKLYQDLLLEPNVGLALDPEWRVQPGKQHLVNIGSVDASEINKTGAWLDALVRDHNLPQKVFLLHQFRLDMITNRDTLVTNYDNLRVIIHADGFGSPGAKDNTWNALHIDAPQNIVWGWKNFYTEDKPMFTPEQTVAVSPDIVWISYQ
jgi:hypothetical protein